MGVILWFLPWALLIRKANDLILNLLLIIKSLNLRFTILKFIINNWLFIDLWTFFTLTFPPIFVIDPVSVLSNAFNHVKNIICVIRAAFTPASCSCDFRRMWVHYLRTAITCSLSVMDCAVESPKPNRRLCYLCFVPGWKEPILLEVVGVGLLPRWKRAWQVLYSVFKIDYGDLRTRMPMTTIGKHSLILLILRSSTPATECLFCPFSKICTAILTHQWFFNFELLFQKTIYSIYNLYDSN